jgi:CHAT domain-containing protein/tetratricopeptide (TPR) repeat protein
MPKLSNSPSGLIVALMMSSSSLIGVVGLIEMPRAIAQTPALSQASATTQEADRLYKLGQSQVERNENDAALQSLQQALKLYQTMNNPVGQMDAIRYIGWAYHQLKKSPQAQEQFQQSLAIARKINNRAGEAKALNGLGSVYEFRQETDRALAFYKQASTIARELNDRKLEALILENTATTYRNLNNWQQEIAVLTRNLALYRELKQTQDEAYTLSGIGIAYSKLKDFAKSIEFHQQSFAVYTKLNNRRSMANTLRNLGLSYNSQKDYPKAASAFTQSLSLYRELKDETNTTGLLLSLALAYQRQADQPQAINYYEQYLSAMRKQSGVFKEEALILKIIGDLYRLQNSTKANSETAIKYYNDSFKVAEKTGNKSDLNHALHGIGIVYMDGELYSFKKSTEYLEKALAGWQSLKDAKMEANALQLLGSIYASAIGNDGKSWCDQGMGYLEQSLMLMQKLDDRSAEAEALNTLAHCYEELKQPQKAIKTQEQGLNIAQRTQNRRQEGLGFVRLAKSYRSLGNLPKATQLAQQGTTILREIQDHKWEVYALDELARIYVASGADRLAIDAQTRRIALAYKYDVRLTNYGFNSIMMNIEQAKKFDFATYRDKEEKRLRNQLAQHGFSLSLLDLLGPKSTHPNQPGFFAPAQLSGKIRESLAILGDAYTAEKKYPQAVELYRSALSEDIEKGYSVGFIDIDLLTKLGNTFANMNRLTEAESHLRLALKYGEEFRTQLGYGEGSTTKKWSDADRIFLAERKTKGFQQLQQVLVRQNRSNEALEIAEEARARTFVELLAARTTGRPLGKDLKDLPPAPKLAAMQQTAKAQNATFVQYSIVDENLLYIWVLKPTGEISFRSTAINPDQPLAKLVTRGRMEIGVRGRGTGKTTRQAQSPGAATLPSAPPNHLTQLHQLLIAPIAAELPQDPNQQVIFLPQGDLFMVPFAALPDVQGKYLIERHTIAIAPSIQTLEFTQVLAKRVGASGNALIIGDPTMPEYNGTRLPALAGARQEAIAISKILNTNPLLGAQATKQTVLQQMQSANILHFATHGLLDTVQGEMPGAIVLAPSGADNGLLTSGEIFDLKLKANLVVLSACDTGSGKITGDGVVGLSRSLIAAGTPSVLVSLWAVNDESTSVLMSEFYRQLNLNPNKAQSLRQAILTTMKQYPEPHDWAAFTLIGER